MTSKLYLLTKRIASFTLSHGKKWLILGFLFLGFYTLLFNGKFFTAELSTEQTFAILFNATYPLKNFSSYELPYFWVIVHLISLLVTFLSVVELLENQSYTLLIRIRSKKLLAFAIVIAVFVSTFLFVVGVGLIMSLSLTTFVFLSAPVVTYLLLLWCSLILVNLLAFLIYLLGQNAILSLLACPFLLILVSLVNYLYLPFKSSLIINGTINYFFTSAHFLPTLLVNLVTFLLFLSATVGLMKKHSF